MSGSLKTLVTTTAFASAAAGLGLGITAGSYMQRNTDEKNFTSY